MVKQKKKILSSKSTHKRKDVEEKLDTDLLSMHEATHFLKNLVLIFSIAIISLNAFHIVKLEILGKKFSNLLNSYPSFIEKFKVAEMVLSREARDGIGRRRFIPNRLYGPVPMDYKDYLLKQKDVGNSILDLSEEEKATISNLNEIIRPYKLRFLNESILSEKRILFDIDDSKVGAVVVGDVLQFFQVEYIGNNIFPTFKHEFPDNPHFVELIAHNHYDRSVFFLADCSRNSTIYLIDYESKKATKYWKHAFIRGEYGKAIRIEPNGKFMAKISHESLVTVGYMLNETIGETFTYHASMNAPIEDFAIGERDIIATIHQDGVVKLLDIDTDRFLISGIVEKKLHTTELEPKEYKFNSIAFDYRSNFLIVSVSNEANNFRVALMILMLSADYELLQFKSLIFDGGEGNLTPIIEYRGINLSPPIFLAADIGSPGDLHSFFISGYQIQRLKQSKSRVHFGGLYAVKVKQDGAWLVDRRGVLKNIVLK